MENNTHNDEITLADIIRKIQEWIGVLKKNLFWVILVSVLGGAAGVGYSAYKGTSYTAELTFATAESEGGGLSKLSALGSQFGFNLGGGSSSAFGGENLLELMKSRRLVETTLFDSITLKNGKKVRLLERYLERNKGEESQNPPVSFAGVSHRDSCSFKQDSTLKQVYQAIVKEKLSTTVVDDDLAFKKVVLNDKDEEFAKGFVEHLTENVTEFYLEIKTQQNKENIAVLEQKADSVKQELTQRMVSAAVLQDRSQYSVNAQNLVGLARQKVEVQLLTTMYAEVIKNLEITKTMAKHNEPLIQLIDGPEFPLEKTRLGKIKGGVMGFVLGLFLVSVWIIGRVSFKQIIGEE